VSIVLGLTIGEMYVSSVRFGYRYDACDLLTFGYSWVNQEQIHLVSMMLRSCLSLDTIICS
jgi:hypothetical protein